MRASKSAGGRRTGMPAAARAMWTRLYSETPSTNLPWVRRDPFPPLVRVVESGWLTPPGPVLDVGCGIGTNALWLAGQGFQVTGVDIAPGAVSAADVAQESHSGNPTFVEDDVLASALPSGRFHGAIDVGCFQTLPPRMRRVYGLSLARLLANDAPLLLFWVGREERGSWGPPFRLSVGEVTDALESGFRVDRVEYRPRTVRLSGRIRRTTRPLATLAGYSARLIRRSSPYPPTR